LSVRWTVALAVDVGHDDHDAVDAAERQRAANLT
jgi:hypothetical protein